jgi:hypothetical protein
MKICVFGAGAIGGYSDDPWCILLPLPSPRPDTGIDRCLRDVPQRYYLADTSMRGDVQPHHDRPVIRRFPQQRS